MSRGVLGRHRLQASFFFNLRITELQGLAPWLGRFGKRPLRFNCRMAFSSVWARLSNRPFQIRLIQIIIIRNKTSNSLPIAVFPPIFAGILPKKVSCGVLWRRMIIRQVRAQFKLMFVSGLTVESKKISISRKGQPKAEEARPCSSELPDIYELRSHTINKMSSQPAHTKSRNSSHNKIYMTNKISEKPTETKEYLSENKIPPRPLRKKESNVGRRSKKLQISKEEGEECLYQMEDRLLAYYRYYPLAVVAGCGFREDLMKSLNERGDFVPYAPKGKKLQRKGLQQLWNKLIKLAQLKGKYKFREKFNVLYSAQLKSLSYKRKQPKKKKQSESSSSDEQVEKKEKCRDMQTWKKSMGVEGSKVFIVKGKYKDLRNALIERGWVENEDRQSLFYDLKWTTKVNDVNFDTLKPHQLVNHFNNNACLTSKYGICKSLRSIMFSEGVEVDRFFPKAYDMSDLQDFENFLEMYKWTYCESLIKKALMNDSQPSAEELMRLKIACLVTSRRLLRGDKLLVNIVNSRYNLCTFNEWRFLTSPKECNMDEIAEDFKLWEMEEWGWTETRKQAHSLLQKLNEREPQSGLNGCGNIWIVKPAFLSRGRGIKCLSDLSDILDYSLGKETQYVVQKYIENPLIINRRKFDIRQWVLVEDYNPPKIWFYGEFYLRFCLEQYNPAKLSNKYAHLTNNSIQKYNSKINAEQLANESMWTQQQLMQYVQGQRGEGQFKEIVAKMKEIVVSTILSTQDQVYGRRNSFELIGYDFMIDEQLAPWLIEINSSPSMDYSTNVTRRLVKMVLEDTVKVVLDLKRKKSKKKTAGLFRCIYDGEAPYEFKRYRMPAEE